MAILGNYQNDFKILLNQNKPGYILKNFKMLLNQTNPSFILKNTKMLLNQTKADFIKKLSLKVLFRDYGWVNLPNNPEMISRMYRKWKS